MKAFVYSNDHRMTGRHDRLILAIPDHLQPPKSIWLPIDDERSGGFQEVHEIEFTRDGEPL